MAKKRTDQKWYQTRTARTSAVLLLALMLALPAISPVFNSPGAVFAPTPTVVDPLARPLPEVPSGGTPVSASGDYFHPTGVFSLPKLVNWDLPQTTPEETTDNAGVQRVGATFNNGGAASVIHAFAEASAEVQPLTFETLNAYYDQANLASAWAKYSTWKERGRRELNGAFVVDFDLTVEDQGYFGRQISRLEPVNGQTWLMVLRLVAPNNNADLLERLTAVLTEGFRMWPQALSVPLGWSGLVNSGYLLRYPNTWQILDGGIGRPYALRGLLEGKTANLNVRAYPGVQMLGDEAARTWVTQNIPRAEVLTVGAVGEGRYRASFTVRDADGNPRSGVVVMQNGPDGAVYAANLQIDGLSGDLLTEGALPAEAVQMFGTFVVTLRPQMNDALTPTPTPGS